MTIVQDRANQLDTIHLDKGAHPDPAAGMCLMEAAAWVAGETHTDRPTCASPILGAFGRSLNDVLPHTKRQQLIPLVPLLVGTAGDGHDQERGLVAADWLIRTYTPAWLRLAGLDNAAVSLETLPRQATWDDVQAAVPVVREARKVARERRAAAWAAAGDAARDAAWDAARDAAGDAARDAAWDAARDAAWDAAWDAAGDAAWAAAGDAARAAAGDAAWDAAGDAARDAAGDVLQPTVDQLQDSAIDLYGQMVRFGNREAGAA